MDQREKFKKPKRDPFDRKRKALEQLERVSPKPRNWMDYLDEEEEEEILEGGDEEEGGEEEDGEAERDPR